MVKRNSTNIGTIASRCHKRRLLQSERSKMTGADLDNQKESFISGVVEGFYGRPWTTEQRKLLFAWMSKMGLNTYMYAPKDDCKHRAYWRELYSVEEADNLTSLIQAAHDSGVAFVYAISPGLDMTFSSSKDVQYLKRKLEQVATFGCNAFAILFDDIDPELCEADKSVFQSFAVAQASVTNEVYEYLSQPKFLFCPTEYCASRAMPSVAASGYLSTIGSKLLPGIEIMWTGPKVVSKKLSVQSLEEIASVLKRPPVIWDNIHANDYDPRRVFLGPYDYRSPEILPYLRGVMSNPNTEFEMNYVPCHTFAQWCKSNPDGVKKDIITGDRLSPVASDIKLETESDYSTEEDLPSRFDTRYQSKQALKAALNEWLLELSSPRQPPKRQLTAPVPPVTSVNTCMTVTPTTCSFPAVKPPEPCSHVLDSNMVEVLDNAASLMQPAMNIVNSLVDPTPESESDTDSVAESHVSEPMECAPSTTLGAEAANMPKNPSSDSLMQVEMVPVNEEPESEGENLMTCEDLCLLVDMFYLPFEHGGKGVELLTDLHWLRSNAHCCSHGKDQQNAAELKEWLEMAKKFEDKVETVEQMLERFFKIPNKSLVNSLYPYLWDMMGVLKICGAYVKWLGLGQVPYLSVCHMQGTFSWFTKGYREAFLSGDQEPWVFRGGLQAEFQRLLPIDAAHDLFFMKPPDSVVQKKYNFRPFTPSDEKAVYEICLRTCDDGVDGTDVFPESPELIGDRLVGALVTISPEYCFVVEDKQGICGYALAALDAKMLHQKSKMAWIPAMQEKYPKPDKEELTPADEVIVSLHGDQPVIAESIYSRYPSVMRLDVLPDRMADPAVPKRLLACALAALKTNGSIGVHCELNVGDKCMIDSYIKMGFFPLTNPEASEEIVYLGRII